jgi:hypothetical protein
MVIGTDYTDSCKSNCHMTMTTSAPHRSCSLINVIYINNNILTLWVLFVLLLINRLIQWKAKITTLSEQFPIPMAKSMHNKFSEPSSSSLFKPPCCRCFFLFVVDLSLFDCINAIKYRWLIIRLSCLGTRSSFLGTRL